MDIQTFVKELNQTSIRDQKWLQEIQNRIKNAFGVVIPISVIVTAMDFAAYLNGFEDSELVSLSLQNRTAIIVDRELLLSKKIYIGFYLRSGGSVCEALTAEMLDMMLNNFTSKQPEYFCTNCGVEITEDDEAYRCYSCR